MNDQLPAEVEEDDDGLNFPKQAKQMFAKLAHMVNSYSGDRQRMRSLVLFEERDPGTKSARPLSRVRNTDTPQAELVLYHRDQVRRLEQTINGMRAFLDESIQKKSLEGLLDCMQELTKWENHRLKHLQMLETQLDHWTDDLSSKDPLVAKMTNDLAMLTQRMNEHRDKMDLANKTAAIPTTAELKERLALKYNVPVDQVDKILAAKSVEAEMTDG